LAVFPIKGFGAIVRGTHRFCETSGSSCDGLADFVMVWREEEGQWQITRVLSYGHRAADNDAGFESTYLEDVSEAPLPELVAGLAGSVAPATLSLSAYVDDLAQKADNATRSLEERQIRLFRGVFRAVPTPEPGSGSRRPDRRGGADRPVS
jgi:hypothetical protein